MGGVVGWLLREKNGRAKVGKIYGKQARSRQGNRIKN
jgi:hypothetical protein